MASDKVQNGQMAVVYDILRYNLSGSFPTIFAFSSVVVPSRICRLQSIALFELGQQHKIDTTIMTAILHLENQLHDCLDQLWLYMLVYTVKLREKAAFPRYMAVASACIKKSFVPYCQANSGIEVT